MKCSSGTNRRDRIRSCSVRPSTIARCMIASSSSLSPSSTNHTNCFFRSLLFFFESNEGEREKSGHERPPDHCGRRLFLIKPRGHVCRKQYNTGFPVCLKPCQFRLKVYLTGNIRINRNTDSCLGCSLCIFSCFFLLQLHGE